MKDKVEEILSTSGVVGRPTEELCIARVRTTSGLIVEVEDYAYNCPTYESIVKVGDVLDICVVKLSHPDYIPS